MKRRYTFWRTFPLGAAFCLASCAAFIGCKENSDVVIRATAKLTNFYLGNELKEGLEKKIGEIEKSEVSRTESRSRNGKYIYIKA